MLVQNTPDKSFYYNKKKIEEVKDFEGKMNVWLNSSKTKKIDTNMQRKFLNDNESNA